MCSRPITKDGMTFACRSCDECVAVRRHGWVARAMAEKADHAHSYCLTLTYSEDTQQSRDAARMFAYADVRAFLMRLRSSARYEAKKRGWNAVPQFRFLCAGEQGDRYGRCHWHLIIYSNVDLARLGQFRLRGRMVSHHRDMITVGKRKRRLNWTLWPHGFMTLQEPDQAAMSYVLSYCLKDQFTGEKSNGTMREAKSENFATGLFRMSKRPAIGENWLMQKMEALEASGAVLPSLNIRVPDMGGYWHPSGLFREKLLWCLHALNRRIVWATGANAPQWPSLLASLGDNQKELDILNGKIDQTENPESPDYESAIGQARKRAAWAAGEGKAREWHPDPACSCTNCLGLLDASQLRERGYRRIWVRESEEPQYLFRNFWEQWVRASVGDFCHAAQGR